MITGKNISLRPLELEDSELLRDLMNNPQVSDYVVGWGFPVSLFSQKNWIQDSNNNSSYRLVILDNESKEAIGITGLWDIDWHNQSATSAIKIIPTKSKKGLGSEAITLSMAWAFYNVGLRRLEATILDFNGPSMSAYVKKCGWRVEGCHKEAVFRKGQWHDLYSIAILKHEFDNLSNINEVIDLVCPVDTTSNIDINYQDYI